MKEFSLIWTSCPPELWSRDQSLWPEGEAMFPSADHLEDCNQNGFNQKVYFLPPQNEHIKAAVGENPTNTQMYCSSKPGGGKRQNAS